MPRRSRRLRCPLAPCCHAHRCHRRHSGLASRCASTPAWHGRQPAPARRPCPGERQRDHGAGSAGPAVALARGTPRTRGGVVACAAPQIVMRQPSALRSMVTPMTTRDATRHSWRLDLPVLSARTTRTRQSGLPPTPPGQRPALGHFCRCRWRCRCRSDRQRWWRTCWPLPSPSPMRVAGRDWRNGRATKHTAERCGGVALSDRLWREEDADARQCMIKMEGKHQDQAAPAIVLVLAVVVAATTACVCACPALW